MRAPSKTTLFTKIVRPIVAVVVVLLVVVSTFAWSKMDALNDGTLNVNLGLTKTSDGATDILLVGSDSRTDALGNPLTKREVAMLHAGEDVESTNTDTILLIRIPDNGRSASAISIPRDTWVSPAGLGPMKINGVYGVTVVETKEQLMSEGIPEAEAEKKATNAGRKALVAAVSELTGVSVDRYAEIGLLGFVLITDAVGGAKVCLNNAVYDPYSGARFPAGVQTLNGSKALSFVRQRHALPRGDLDRITRQQVYMASMVRQTLSAGVLTNPDKLNKLTQAVKRSVVIDQDWDVISFAQQMQHLMGDRVKFATIPIENPDAHMTDAAGNEVSAIEVDPEEVKEWVADLIKEQEKADGTRELPKPGRVNIDRKSVQLSVLNAGSLGGLAGAVASYLESVGYQTKSTGNSDSATTNSYVVGNPETLAAAQAVAKDLGGLPVESSRDVPVGTVRVVLSDDYDGPAMKNGKAVFADQLELPTRAPNSANSGTRPPINAGGKGPQCVN